MMNPFDDQESSKILFNQLGDAFRHGMITELSDHFNDPEDADETHLYASVAYMYLNGLISQDATVSIYRTLFADPLGGERLNDVVKTISKDIFDELLDKYHFTNLNDLLDILNETVIPNWYFDIGSELVSHSVRGMFLYDEYLFFIAEENDKLLFVKLNQARINTDNSLDKQKKFTVLGYGYSEIYGFDDKLARVYLGVQNQNGFYHCYDMVSNSFIVCSNELLAVRNGIPYVITKDNYFAYVMGDIIHKIKKYYDFENYVQQKNCFLVVPKSTDTSYFYPYCVTYDGRVLPADDEDCKKHIWRELKCVVCAEDRLRYTFFSEFDENDNKVFMPKRLSIKSILGAFKDAVSNSELCMNKKFIIFESLCDLLRGYINPDDDITQLLYLLYDLDRIVRREYGEFPSEQLYWKFKELNESGEDKERLRKALKTQNYDAIKIMVLENIPYRKDEENESGLIGEFSFGEEGLTIYTMDKRCGVVIGSQIVCNTNLNVQGMVSFDCSYNMYYVISERILTNKDKMEIVKGFKLPKNHYIFVVQHRKDSNDCEVKYKDTKKCVKSYETVCEEYDEEYDSYINAASKNPLIQSLEAFLVEMEEKLDLFDEE